MQDLGFTFKKHQNKYIIYHRGKKACRLRGDKAAAFQAAVESGDQVSQQRLMARLTGNYKRGNERSAKSHPRNN